MIKSIRTTTSTLNGIRNIASFLGGSVLPSLSGNNNKYLKIVNGEITWATVSASGGSAVDSMTITQPAAGLTITNSGVAQTGDVTFTLALANDLAALEALSGTDTIYYRSGVSAWTAVAIGGSLLFSGGTLNLGTTPALGTPASGNLANCTFPTLNQSTTGSAASLTTARSISMTGDVAWTLNFDGTGNVTAAGTLATVNSNLGQFGSATAVARPTVNAKGLITAIDSVTITPAITSVTGLGTDVLAALQIQLDTTGGLTSKSYVDNALAGLKWKASVLCATTANITLSGEQTIDGVLTSASRVLVKNQSTASQNGIYLSSSGSWTRATDADSGTELVNATVGVEQGTTQADKLFTCTNNSITLGSTSVTFVNFASTIVGALLAANNLSDLASVSTARDNLGLGTASSPNFLGLTLDGNLVFSAIGGATISLSADLTLTGGNLILPGITINSVAFAPSAFAATLATQTTAIASLKSLQTQGADIASASTVNLSTATGWAVTITGTTTITAFTSQTAGNAYLLTFAGVLTLTHNATSLICPGGASITTAAGDTAVVLSLGSGNWKVLDYTRVSGKAVIAPAVGDVTDLGTGTSTALAINQGTAGSFATTGRTMIPIMACGMSPSATGGCAALATIASAANQPDIQTLDFDATTQEYAQFSMPMPSSWDRGTITAVFEWSHAATTTNFGVVWDIQAVAVSNDDPIAVAFGTAVTSTDTGGTTNDHYVSPETSAMTVAGTPASGDKVFFRISRVTGNGSDTMAIDARLHSIQLWVTLTSGVDT